MNHRKRAATVTKENAEKFVEEYLPKIIARLKKEGKLSDIERKKPVE
ncbi:hypothetical protein [Aneurinibacillus sp. REN35]